MLIGFHLETPDEKLLVFILKLIGCNQGGTNAIVQPV